MGDYEKYLDYTGQDYMIADKDEKKNIIAASMIYLMQTRAGLEMNEENYNTLIESFTGDSDQAQTTQDLLETVFRYAPDKTVREVLGTE